MQPNQPNDQVINSLKNSDICISSFISKITSLSLQIKNFLENLLIPSKHEKPFIKADIYVLISIIFTFLIPSILFLLALIITIILTLASFLLYPLYCCIPAFLPIKNYLKNHLNIVTFTCKSLIMLIIILIYSLILVIPAVLVVVIQILSVIYIVESIQLTPLKENDNLAVKWMLNVIFLLLCGINLVKNMKNLIFFILRIKPLITKSFFVDTRTIIQVIDAVMKAFLPFLKILLIYLLSYLSICLLYSNYNMIHFIEYFIWFFFILDLDNMAVKFLQIIRFYSFFTWFLLKTTRQPDNFFNYHYGYADILDILNFPYLSSQKFKQLIRIFLDDENLKEILNEKKIFFSPEDINEYNTHKKVIILVKLFVILLGIIFFVLCYNYKFLIYYYYIK